MSAPLDDIHGSRAVNKARLEVSAIKSETKTIQKLKFFQRHGL